MQLNELQALNKKGKASKYMADGAIEAENLATYSTTEGVNEQSQMNVWGEMSNRAFKGFKLTLPGQKVSVSITEQFTKVNLKVCLITNPQSGLFDIAVNGKPVQTINLYSEHAAFPVIELGSFSPVNNAFEIIFTRKDNKTDAGETLLGIDYFIVK